MDIELLRDYCLSKPHTTEGTPFGPEPLVMKVHGKMYCLFNMSNFESVNLKCKPEDAEEMRANYVAIEPGYHMSKKHWNTVKFDKDASDDFILKMVDISYELVYSSLPKKIRDLDSK